MWPFSKKKPEPEPEPAPPPPPPETELAKLQREVFERLVSGTPGPQGIDDWRLQIYAGMYESRTHDALVEDVPHVAAIVGAEFPALVKKYVTEHSSTHHSLARLGHGLSKWLREHPAARPDLADLCELEWARSEAFVADDFSPVEPEAVQQMGPERFTAATMHLVPSLRLLELQHDVLALWKAAEDKAALPEPSPTPTHVVVWRKGFEVFHVAIALDEAQALKAAIAGETVEQICERFAGRGEEAPQAAFQAIGSWLNEGMVAVLREKPVAEAFGL